MSTNSSLWLFSAFFNLPNIDIWILWNCKQLRLNSLSLMATNSKNLFLNEICQSFLICLFQLKSLININNFIFKINTLKYDFSITRTSRYLILFISKSKINNTHLMYIFCCNQSFISISRIYLYTFIWWYCNKGFSILVK